MPTPPWRLLQPPKTLHEVPDRGALDALIDQHKHKYDRHWQTNMLQLVGEAKAPRGQRNEAEGWCLFGSEKWICKDGDKAFFCVNPYAVSTFLVCSSPPVRTRH